jgi:hypothetical protein
LLFQRQDQIADLVVERLMEKNGSLANLGTASLEVIEEQTLASVDQAQTPAVLKKISTAAVRDC